MTDLSWLHLVDLSELQKEALNSGLEGYLTPERRTRFAQGAVHAHEAFHRCGRRHLPRTQRQRTHTYLRLLWHSGYACHRKIERIQDSTRHDQRS